MRLTDQQSLKLLRSCLWTYVSMEEGGAAFDDHFPLGGDAVLEDRLQAILGETIEELPLEFYASFLLSYGDLMQRLLIEPGTYEVIDTRPTHKYDYVDFEESNASDGAEAHRCVVKRPGLSQALISNKARVEVSLADIESAKACYFQIANLPTQSNGLVLQLTQVSAYNKKGLNAYLYTYPGMMVDGKRPDGNGAFAQSFHDKMYLILQAFAQYAVF